MSLVGHTDLYFSRKHRNWEWVRLVCGAHIDPGHEWLYSGLVRRDTYTVLGVGVVLLRLVRDVPEVEATWLDRRFR